VITMFVDPKDHTMATLFGNDEAMQAVKGGRTKKGFVPAYPAGSVLALLTWNQREDPHWFGARVPDNPQSIEFVETDASGNGRAYQCYAGPLLKEHIVPIEEGKKRSGILLNLVPATLP